MIEGNDVVIVDVRTAGEFREEHIDGAILIPLQELGDKADVFLPDKQTTLLIYCLVGTRSKAAARILAEMGYENIYDFGGIIDWQYGTVGAD